MYHKILIALAVLYIASPVVAQQTTSVAVLEFKASGLSPAESATLTNRFRSILASTRKFTIVEREKMDEILKAQDFNMSDACNTAECAVQVGQLLGVEQMIAGDVGRLGPTWTIDLRLIDVQSGKLLATKSQNYRGEVDGMLDVMMTIAAAFAGSAGLNAADAVVTTEVGDMFVSSVPSGAEIFIDGIATGHRTPKLIERLQVGEHAVSVRTDEMEAGQSTSVTKGGIAPVKLVLRRKTATVKVVSEPFASVFMEGVKKGESPLVLQLPKGRHAITFYKDGYQSLMDTVDVDENYEERVVFGMLNPVEKIQSTDVAAVRIVAINEKGNEITAELSVDDVLLGQTPYAGAIRTGEHVLRISFPDGSHRTVERAINLVQSGTITLMAKSIKKNR